MLVMVIDYLNMFDSFETFLLQSYLKNSTKEHNFCQYKILSQFSKFIMFVSYKKFKTATKKNLVISKSKNNKHSMCETHKENFNFNQRERWFKNRFFFHSLNNQIIF